jgi:hypothetical protein
LFTLKVAVFSVFVIVQVTFPPLATATLAHGAWLAV